MYEFIQTLHPECSISQKDIMDLEEEYKISIPAALKEFYLKYNGADIFLCRFFPENSQVEMVEVHTIYPIKYTPYEKGAILERVLNSDRMDGFIPSELIPFAQDRGGNRCYCDKNSGKVYFISSDDIDNPVAVCEKISDFLDNLKKF